MYMFQVSLKCVHIDCCRKEDLSQMQMKAKNEVSEDAISPWTFQVSATFSCFSDSSLRLLEMSTHASRTIHLVCACTVAGDDP